MTGDVCASFPAYVYLQRYPTGVPTGKDRPLFLDKRYGIIKLSWPKWRNAKNIGRKKIQWPGRDIWKDTPLTPERGLYSIVEA